MKRRGAGTIAIGDVGSRVRLQAWVQRRRDLGGLLFLDLRDRSGVVQVVIRPGASPEAGQILGTVRPEWVVEIEGTVARREPGQINRELPTGEVEVIAESAAVLSRSETPPFPLDGRIEAAEDLRLRYRYLDLRRPELQKNFILRDRVTHEIRGYFHEQGFLDVETPILTKSTPEGARDYLVPSRVHHGSFYALPQSPQLFKQILMISGCEKYFQIVRCFRDEDLRADRQLEFTQIDLEMTYPQQEQVFEVVEGFVGAAWKAAGVTLPAKFPRMTYDQAMQQYGSDKPDLRLPALVDVK